MSPFTGGSHTEGSKLPPTSCLTSGQLWDVPGLQSAHLSTKGFHQHDLQWFPARSVPLWFCILEEWRWHKSGIEERCQAHQNLNNSSKRQGWALSLGADVRGCGPGLNPCHLSPGLLSLLSDKQRVRAQVQALSNAIPSSWSWGCEGEAK